MADTNLVAAKIPGEEIGLYSEGSLLSNIKTSLNQDFSSPLAENVAIDGYGEIQLRESSSEDHDHQPFANQDFSSPQPEPIAIVGVGLRLPGGIHTTAAFWDLLLNKRETRCPVPPTRYNIDGFYNTSKKNGSVASEYGHFLAESDRLDALDTSFFTMSKAEAEQIDPQQRMILEVVWECMENGGQTGWRGENIGVYLGTFNEDWQDLLGKDIQSSGPHKIVSSGDFVVANRISYEYDLKGPSFAIKTACSSAMIGVHEACRAIRNGDCNSAIIAGTNLILTPTMTVTMSEQGILSPDGRSKVFDESANGYGRGEAINAIYIKKLSDALANNDPIRGIIRGTAVNADGRTSGITMPGVDAHERLIKHAYKFAQIDDPSQTAFFECHGTGTAVGDPLETKAVARVFGGEKGIYIGSVKANVGHSEASSGLTSIIKSLLALEHKLIPPNIHFTKPNPNIPFEEGNLRVPVEPVPWPESQLERVSVNSFGIAGSNAHVILDSAASLLPKLITTSQSALSRSRPKLLVFSASNAESLTRYAKEIKVYAANNPHNDLNLAYTLGVRREHLSYRSFSILNETGLSELAPITKHKANIQVNYVFTGQGAQWARMGKELMDDFPAFNDDIEQLSRIISELPDASSWNLRDQLLKDSKESNLDKAEFSQPLCTAIQLALVNLLRSLNILPAGVIGHSSGEIAAAYAAGSLTMREAILVAYYRGQATKMTTRKGSMAAVGMGRTEVNLYLKHGVVIACENSQSSVTLSGDTDILERVLADIRSNEPDVFTRLLKVEMAYHSHHMKDFGSRYEQWLEPHISTQAPTIPFFSSVTGKQITEQKILQASYWRQNLESPVLFLSAVQECIRSQAKDQLFLELGPHSALAGPLRQIFKVKESQDTKSNLSYLATLVRGKDCTESLLRSIGQIFLQTTGIDFKGLTSTGKVLTDLPLYQWRHDTTHWSEARLTQDWRFRKFGRHELLGSRTLESSDLEPSWRNILKIEDVPWLVDHKIIEDVVFPCAGYVSMAGEAIRQLSGVDDYSIRRLNLKSALVLLESKGVEMITNLRPIRQSSSTEIEWYEFTILSHNNSSWTRHCIGQIRAGKAGSHDQKDLSDLPRSMSVPYQSLRQSGLNYGPNFQCLDNVSTLPGKYTAVANLKAAVKFDTYYALHPTTIDGCLQVIAIAMSEGIGRNMNRLCVPTDIETLYVSSKLAKGSMKAQGAATITPRAVLGSAVLVADNEILLSLTGGKLSQVEAEISVDDHKAGAAELEWAPHIDFVKLDTLIHSVPKPLDKFDAVHRLTLLTTLEIASFIPSLKIATDYLQKFCKFVVDYVADAKSGKLLHFKNVHVKKLTSLTPEERLELLNKTRAEIAVTHLEPIGELVYRLLQNYRGIIEGNTKAIEVLIKDDALTNLYNLLGSMVDCGCFFTASGHSNPGLRILEIGAGTGGTSAIALRNLISSHGEPMYSKYSYTDISPGFFPTASERFKMYPNIQYQILDITKDPLEQGYEEGSYDLVIATNVLHATPSLVTTLSNVRKLLQPNGRLFLQELNPGSVQYIDLIMGGLRDWWLGDGDDRADKPYVDVARWDNDLRKAGFSGVDGVVYDDEAPNILLNIVARPVQPVDHYRSVTLLCSSRDSAVADQVEKVLVARKYTVQRCTLRDRMPPHQDILSILDLETAMFKAITPDNLGLFMKLLTKLGSVGILWATKSVQIGCEDPYHALIIGLSRTIRSELSIPFATLELDESTEVGYSALVNVLDRFRNRDYSGPLDPEGEYALINGTINVSRYHWFSLAKELATSCREQVSLQLDIERLGSLPTLRWIPHTQDEVGEGKVLVKVSSVGLNYQDLATALGINNQSSAGFGLEASGIIQEVGNDVQELQVGDRVMMIGQTLFSTSVVINKLQCIRIPEEITFEEAATIPLAFSTAIQGLVRVGRLQKGETVLIHNACDSIGLAAMQICQMIGAKIFATTSSDAKTAYLIEHFAIPREHIFSSLDASFLKGLKTATGGNGVDLVLNSLSGEFMHTTWSCVADYGRLVDIAGRYSSLGVLELPLSERNRSYINLDLTHFSAERQNLLLEDISTLLGNGAIKPVRPLYAPNATTAEAFANLQKDEEIGQHVFNLSQNHQDFEVAPVVPKIRVRSDVSYLLVGGLGAVGKAISTWLVECGARHLIYLSPSAGKSSKDKRFFSELASQNCSVQAFPGSVTDYGVVERVINSASKPVVGIVQMAMVLHDALLSDMTHIDWEGTLGPRVQGTWNLHEATLHLPLDFFIMMSSISGTIGSRGQGNYAASNTFLDAFVQYRQRHGLTACVIDVGRMAGNNVDGSSSTVDAILQSQSVQFISESDILDAFQLAIIRSQHVTPMVDPTIPYVCKNHLTIGLRSSRLLSDPSNRIPWKRDLRMSIARNLDGSTKGANEKSKNGELDSLLSSIESDEAVLQKKSTSETITSEIGRRIYALMLQPSDELDVRQSLDSLGVDSLVTIEIRTWWRRSLGFEVSTLEILNANTIQGLGELALQGLQAKFKKTAVLQL